MLDLKDFKENLIYNNYVDRKQEILELIKEGEQSAKKIAEKFGVSLMSIYRDLKTLEEEGLIIRKYGRLEIASKIPKEIPPKNKDLCAFCQKENTDRLKFSFYLENGRQIHTCCPHCGLMMYKSIIEPIEAIITKDFITCNLVGGASAYYVLGSSAAPCCSPSALAFARKEDAYMFKSGFGGDVFEFGEATKIIWELMKYGNLLKIGKIDK